MSTITISHIGSICPWYSMTRDYLSEYCDKHNISFSEELLAVSDIEKTKGFPFVVSIDGEVITGSPVFGFNIDDLFEKRFKGISISDNDLSQGKVDRIELMDKANIHKSISLCMNGESKKSDKGKWYMDNQDRMIGFIGYSGSTAKVIFESFIRNENSAKTIIISCFYSNDEKYDYKVDMFSKCRNKLKDMGIASAEIIVGESSYYPNGKKTHFERMGFREIMYLGDIYLLNRGCDKIYKLGLTL